MDLPFTTNQVAAIMKDMDVDQGGTIEFLEFLRIVHALSAPEGSRDKLAPQTVVAFNAVKRKSGITATSKACVVM